MNAPDQILRPAQGSDLPGIVLLLAACGLPSSDLSAASLAHFHVIESVGQVVGVAGYEVAGSHGLLRSVAVTPASRDMGLAGRLVAATEASAEKAGLSALYLLASDAGAARYFGRIGYLPVERGRVPSGLLALPEFSQLCPQSCPSLRKVLDIHSFKEPEPSELKLALTGSACSGSTVASCCKQ